MLFWVSLISYFRISIFVNLESLIISAFQGNSGKWMQLQRICKYILQRLVVSDITSNSGHFPFLCVCMCVCVAIDFCHYCVVFFVVNVIDVILVVVIASAAGFLRSDHYVDIVIFLLSEHLHCMYTLRSIFERWDENENIKVKTKIWKWQYKYISRSLSVLLLLPWRKNFLFQIFSFFPLSIPLTK